MTLLAFSFPARPFPLPETAFARKAIALNHEFLTDEAVINANTDIGTYQTLLLEKAGMKSGSFVTSQFHYSIAKKDSV